MQNVELQNNSGWCLQAGLGDRSAQPIVLTDLPWSRRKWQGGPSALPKIQLTGPSAEILRTVCFTKCHPNSVSDGSVCFSSIAGGPSAGPDRTVRWTQFKLPDTVFGPADDTSVTFHGKSMKPYDPSFVYKGPYGHKLTLPTTPTRQSPKHYKKYDACSPYAKIHYYILRKTWN